MSKKRTGKKNDEKKNSTTNISCLLSKSWKSPARSKTGMVALFTILMLIAGTMFIQEPVRVAGAANSGTKMEDGTATISDESIEVTFDSEGYVTGWTRSEEQLPIQLPKRNITIDEQGNTVIQIDDPDSLIFDRLLLEVERLPEVRAVDEQAIKLAKEYDSAAKAPTPYMQNNGRINFYFGTMNPRLQCRPLRLTDIELEPGERLTKIHVSDTARWSVTVAVSGGIDNLVTHVIVKPLLPEIAANLLIHTDRRTYSIELLSVANDQYMPYVGFIYPEVVASDPVTDESFQKLREQYGLVDKAQAQSVRRRQTESAQLADPATIYTGYTIRSTRGNKNVVWKPKDVYDANGKTYIVMDEKVGVADAPTFFIKYNGRETLANYRIDGNKYVVDRIFDIGILTIGKDRVAIYRNKPIGQN